MLFLVQVFINFVAKIFNIYFRRAETLNEFKFYCTILIFPWVCENFQISFSTFNKIRLAFNKQARCFISRLAYLLGLFTDLLKLSKFVSSAKGWISLNHYYRLKTKVDQELTTRDIKLHDSQIGIITIDLKILFPILESRFKLFICQTKHTIMSKLR